MKFKNGQLVRLLPSAAEGGISKDSVGKTGVVIEKSCYGSYYLVRMDKPRKGNARCDTWAVYSNQMESAVQKGQQLVFSFMEE